jgi:hypothetical protein
MCECTCNENSHDSGKDRRYKPPVIPRSSAEQIAYEENLKTYSPTPMTDYLESYQCKEWDWTNIKCDSQCTPEEAEEAKAKAEAAEKA